MLFFLADGSDGDKAWAVGLIPSFVGVALLLSSSLYSRFAADDARRGPPKA